MVLARVLVIGALVWPAMLGAALWDRVEHQTSARSVWASVVYLAAAQVCHQQAARSFETGGESWPVCARCAGLYLAAPFGGLWFVRRRRTGRVSYGWPPARVFVVAAIPTALTLAWEWAGWGMPANSVRFASAVPLGAAILWVLLDVTRGSVRDSVIN